MKKATFLPISLICSLPAARPTNYPPSPAPRSCCLSCPRRGSSTPLPLRNCNRSSPNPKAKISSRHVSMRPTALSPRPCPLVRRSDAPQSPWVDQEALPSRTTCPVASQSAVAPPTRPPKTKTTPTTTTSRRTAAAHRQVTNAGVARPLPTLPQAIQAPPHPTPAARPHPIPPTRCPRRRSPSPPARQRTRSTPRRRRSRWARRRLRSSSTNRPRRRPRSTRPGAHTGTTRRSSSTTSSRSTTTARWATRRTS